MSSVTPRRELSGTTLLTVGFPLLGRALAAICGAVGSLDSRQEAMTVASAMTAAPATRVRVEWRALMRTSGKADGRRMPT